MREFAVSPSKPLPMIVTGVVVALALLIAVLLWAHYGTAVFFETIRAGFSACFG